VTGWDLDRKPNSSVKDKLFFKEKELFIDGESIGGATPEWSGCCNDR
jgi:hypothetical protein